MILPGSDGGSWEGCRARLVADLRSRHSHDDANVFSPTRDVIMDTQFGLSTAPISFHPMTKLPSQANSTSIPAPDSARDVAYLTAKTSGICKTRKLAVRLLR